MPEESTAKPAGHRETRIGSTDGPGWRDVPVGCCRRVLRDAVGAGVGDIDRLPRRARSFSLRETNTEEEGLQQAKEYEAQCSAEQIANGHGFEKHKDEFPGVETPKDLEEIIIEVIEHPSDVRELERGRTAYYDAETNTVVITDPASPDGGTIFKPDLGSTYFEKDLR